MAGWKNPRRGVYRRVRLHFAQSSSGHRSKCRMRFLLGPCGALCAQIWPLGGQNRARGTFASLRTDGEISEVPRNTPFFHQLLGRNKHFPAFPSMIRACYGRCESLTTFQCQVVENEAWPQTDRSLDHSMFNALPTPPQHTDQGDGTAAIAKKRVARSPMPSNQGPAAIQLKRRRGTTRKAKKNKKKNA